MKIETPAIIWKRFFIFGIALVLILGIIDRILLNFSLEEEKNEIVLEALQTHKIISNELHTVFHSVQDDFNFFEKKILNIIRLRPHSSEYQYEIRSQIDFLETHPGYFKVRLTDSRGQELFKIVQNPEHSGFALSEELFNLSGQRFFQELLKVKGKDFYFSSMDANIINGVIEKPIRPTIRVSKRVELSSNNEGILNFNIDGQKILKLFQENFISENNGYEIALIDGEGFYLGSAPLKELDKYTLSKISINEIIPGALKILNGQKSIQGSFDAQGGIIVYSRLKLPNTMEHWFILTRVPEAAWNKIIRKQRLTWIFWESTCFVLMMVWLWRDEKKRHKDQVVKVLLKERSEFIQNVSHQLKTPLAIMINSLEKKIPTSDDWTELKKEMHYLIKVVEDMLLLAQVDAFQKLPLKEEDILDIVSVAVDMTGPKAKEKDVHIRFNVDEKLLASTVRLERPVAGDLLTSAIVNLIDNAIDFSPKGEVVNVFVAFVEGKLVIQVKDNGPGIAEDFIPKLFERFSQGNQLKRKGTGLGLAIAKKIVELHNGELLLTKYKDGAVFEIRL